MTGDSHLEGCADDGGEFCCAEIACAEDALHNEEVGRPVAEADDEA